MEKVDKNTFILHVASVDLSEESTSYPIKVDGEDATLKVRYGDFASALTKAANALKEVCRSRPGGITVLLILTLYSGKKLCCK